MAAFYDINIYEGVINLHQIDLERKPDYNNTIKRVKVTDAGLLNTKQISCRIPQVSIGTWAIIILTIYVLPTLGMA